MAATIASARFRLTAIGTAAALAAMLVFAPPPPARGHAAMSGWAYPSWCCNERDCVALHDSDVFEAPDHFALMATGETIPRALARRSGDGGYHLCRAANGAIRCFFRPDRVM